MTLKRHSENNWPLGVKNGLVPNSFALILKHARRNAALNDGNKCHEYITRILRWNWNDGKVKSGKGGQGIFHAAHQWVVSCMYASMTTFLTHTVAHSTKRSFMPKTNNQPPKKALSLALSWTEVVKNGKILTFKVNFLSQKISNLSKKKISLKNMILGAH